MCGRYVLDENNVAREEPNLLAWGEWMESDARVVAKDRIETSEGTYLVSTVFLGLDHAFGESEPVLWETMIFVESGKNREHDNDMWRYCSHSAAVEGHKSAIAFLRNLESRC